MDKKRILVIDDSPSVTALLKLKLEDTGLYEVREENDGARSLDSAREFSPDLIVLDIVMPNMDGGDVEAQLRDDPQLQRTPVVFLTCAVKKDEVGQAGGMMIRGRLFIPKPIDMRFVLRSVEEYLSIPDSR